MRTNVCYAVRPDRLDRGDFLRWQRINAFPAVSDVLTSRRVM
jgi:hypothetical protein